MNEVFNKKALVDLLSEEKELSKKHAGEIVDFIFDSLKTELSNGKIYNFTSMFLA